MRGWTAIYQCSRIRAEYYKMIQIKRYVKHITTTGGWVLCKYGHMAECIRDISLDSIENNCRFFNCGVDDILEFIPDEDGGKEND